MGPELFWLSGVAGVVKGGFWVEGGSLAWHALGGRGKGGVFLFTCVFSHTDTSWDTADCTAVT